MQKCTCAFVHRYGHILRLTQQHTCTCTHMQRLCCDLSPGLRTLRAACTWGGPTTSYSCASPGLWLVAEDRNSQCWRDEPCRGCQEQAAQNCHPALALPLQTECGSSGLPVVPKAAHSRASSTSMGLGLILRQFEATSQSRLSLPTPTFL